MRTRLLCQILLATVLLPPLALAQEAETPPTPSTQSPSDLADPFVPNSEGNAADSDLNRFTDYSTDDTFNSCGCDFPQMRAPNMIGDYFGGYAAGGRGSFVLDRLAVVANDLDSPAVLPPGGSTLTISEPGPVGIFSSSLVNVQQLQQLLRAGAPLPTSSLAGTIADNGTLTTTLAISQIQALLGSTAQPWDIVPLAAPPGSYNAGVNAAFVTRNGAGGTTNYDGAGSGALLQGGADTLNGGEDFDAFYFYTYALAVNVPSPSAGVGPVGRLKVSDGNSPLPRDRAYFRYDWLNGAELAPGGIDLDRFTPGIERTFAGGMLSAELRIPFAATLDSNIVTGPGGFGGHNVEFGNLALFGKMLLYATDELALSGGVGITLPTADDVNVRFVDGTPLVHVANQSVHLKPFFAGLYTPNDRFFTQAFLEVDTDLNGNATFANSGTGLSRVGRLNDASYLYADLGIGYWLQQRSSTNWIGIAPTVELHYNTSLQAADSITAGGLQIGSFGTNVEALNLTVGATLELGHCTNLSLGYITPLGGGADQQFDGGFRLMLDYCPSRRF